PHDIHIDGKKIAGVLLELTGDPADVCEVVIGDGINVNMLADAVEIGQACTTMQVVSGNLVYRNELTRVLNRSFQHYLNRHTDEGFSGLRAEWESNNIWRGQRCCLSTGSQHIKGLVLGVDEQGALRLMVDGQESRFSGGELSLRLDHDS